MIEVTLKFPMHKVEPVVFSAVMKMVSGFIGEMDIVSIIAEDFSVEITLFDIPDLKFSNKIASAVAAVMNPP
jgi:hypothetical protein